MTGVTRTNWFNLLRVVKDSLKDGENTTDTSGHYLYYLLTKGEEGPGFEMTEVGIIEQFQYFLQNNLFVFVCLFGWFFVTLVS